MWFRPQCMALADTLAVWLPFQMLSLDSHGHVIIKFEVMSFDAIVNLMPSCRLHKQLCFVNSLSAKDIIGVDGYPAWHLCCSLLMHQRISLRCPVPMHVVEQGRHNHLMI